MKLSVQEMVDYCRCPMFYYLRYLDTVARSEETAENFNIELAEKYDKNLHQCIYAFYSKIQEGLPPEIKHLKRAWGSLWIGRRTKDEVLIKSGSNNRRDTFNKRRLRGISAIVRFFEKFQKNPGFPLAINTTYELPLGDNLVLTGTWELIREIEVDGKKVMEILRFHTDDGHYNINRVECDVILTAANLAFKHAFKRKADRLCTYGMDKGKFHAVERTETHESLLMYTATCVAKNIEDGRFPACPGEHCQSCAYKTRCHALHENKAAIEALLKGVK